MVILSVPMIWMIHFFLTLLSSNPILTEWKSKLEECEKEIQEWEKQASAATTSLSKLNRQINSKVSRFCS